MQDKQLYLFGVQSNGGENLKKQRLGLPLDILIISGVVFVLSLIVAFSLGIEKGKKIALKNLSPDMVLAEKNVEEAKETISDKGTVLDSKAELKVEKSEPPAEVSNAPVETVSDKQKYNIQVASFAQETAARREVKELKEKGYPASVSKKGKYIVIYVGEFEDKEEAKSKLELLKKRYKDCILRQL